jgi:hypothetical protein
MDDVLEDVQLITRNYLGDEYTTPAADDVDWADAVSPIPMSGLVGWWKANEGIVTAANGSVDEVTSWADQSGANNDLSVSATILRPPYHSNGGPGDAAYLSFDGARNMYIPTLGIPASTQDITMFLVLRSTSASNLGVVAELTTSVLTNNDGCCIATNDGNDDTIEVVFSGDVGLSVSQMDIPNNTWAYMRAEAWKSKSSHEAQCYVSGVAPSSMTVDDDNTNSFATSAPFYIGGRLSSPYFFIGDISEVIFYARALTGPEITDVENYLSTKYGL